MHGKSFGSVVCVYVGQTCPATSVAEQGCYSNGSSCFGSPRFFWTQYPNSTPTPPLEAQCTLHDLLESYSYTTI